MARQATRKRSKGRTQKKELVKAHDVAHDHRHHHYPSATTPYDMMTMMAGTKSNPEGEIYAFHLSHMLGHIRKNATMAKANDYASVKTIPEQARTSLALFYVDWGGNDINHEQYLNNLPDGYPTDEALKMGELLYWCIGGKMSSPSVQLRKTRAVSTEWGKLIEKSDENGQPYKKGASKKLSLPKGVSIHDLTGLHIELLNMLPQRTYTHYTLNQLFIENRQMYDALFQDFVALNPMEHDTLQVLQRIVEQGNIERFRLAMMHGTQGKVRKMLSDGTFGANLLDAFSEAKEAVSAYKRGDYAQSRLSLEKLQLEYGLAPDLFQLGLSEMFIVHAAAPVMGTGNKIALKGPNTQLLVSIDKTVGPDGGWPGRDAIRDRMSGPAFKINDSGVINQRPDPTQGTPGSRIFSNNTNAVITTDWVYFFAAINSKKPPTNASVQKTQDAAGLDEAKRTVRLLIHARVDKGFEDLVPKGTILATIRPTTVGTVTRKSNRRSAQSKHGRGRGRGKGGSDKSSGGSGGSSQSNGLMNTGKNSNQVIGMVDLIFEDFGGLFDKDETKGGTFRSKDKKPEASIEETGKATEEQLTASIRAELEAMQPEETADVSDIAGLLSRRSAKRSDYHDYIEGVKAILKKEGGAAGLKPLKAAFPKNTTKAQAQRMLAQMPGVVLHADGDYILVDTLANPNTCPRASFDLKVNTNNRDHAIEAEYIQYGPLNLSDEAYWERYAKKWNTIADVAKDSNCSNCAAFDISPRMKKCMPGETSDNEGELGYCWMHHFKCHSARTCYTWASGGPIVLDSISHDWQERNAQVVKSNPHTPKIIVTDPDGEDDWTEGLTYEEIIADPRYTKQNPAKGGGRSMGQTIVIELTPKAELTIHKSREDAKWLKMVAKNDPEIKALYDKYAKTSSRSKAQEGRVKKGKKKGEGITGGSYVLYKGNQTALKMIKAPRKDNNEFVPWLLMIPHILVRQGDDGSLIGKKGSGAEAGIKNLLEEVEKYYGTPKFKTNLGMGGFRLISERTARKMKQSGSAGKRVVDLAVHEGVKKVFTTPGVEVELEGKKVMARPDRYKVDGDIMYRARTPSTKKIVHFQQSRGGSQ